MKNKALLLGIIFFFSCGSRSLCQESFAADIPIVANLSAYITENPRIVITVSTYFVLRYLISHYIFPVLLQHHNNKVSRFLCNLFYYGCIPVDPQTLLKACKDNNTRLALTCFEYGVNAKKAKYIHYPGPEPWRPLYETNALHAACHYGNQEIIEKLLVLGIDVNQRDHNCLPPLYFAAQSGIKTFILLAKHNVKTPLCRRIDDHACYDNKYLMKDFFTFLQDSTADIATLTKGVLLFMDYLDDETMHILTAKCEEKERAVLINVLLSTIDKMQGKGLRIQLLNQLSRSTMLKNACFEHALLHANNYFFVKKKSRKTLCILNSDTERVTFLHTQLLKVDKISDLATLDVFVQFCVNNGAQIQHANGPGKVLIGNAIAGYTKESNTDIKDHYYKRAAVFIKHASDIQDKDGFFQKTIISN